MSGAGGDPTSGLTLYPTLCGVSFTCFSPHPVDIDVQDVKYSTWECLACVHNKAGSVLFTIYESCFSSKQMCNIFKNSGCFISPTRLPTILQGLTLTLNFRFIKVKGEGEASEVCVSCPVDPGSFRTCRLCSDSPRGLDPATATCDHLHTLHPKKPAAGQTSPHCPINFLHLIKS